MAKTNRNALGCLDLIDRKMSQAKGIVSLLEDVGGSTSTVLPDKHLLYVATCLTDLLDEAHAAVNEYHGITCATALRSVDKPAA